MQLFKTDSESRKPEKPPAVPGLPDVPPAPSSTSAPAAAPTKSASPPAAGSQPTQAAPTGQHGLPLVDGTGSKEEYGYIVTNQRSSA